MEITFENRTAVVTGAAGGLGRAVCDLLVGAGADVIGLDLAPVDQAGVRELSVDMADPSSIDAAVDAIGAGVDVICNIAGLPQTKPAGMVMRVNYLGMRHLVDALGPTMAEGGTVVNVASNAGNSWTARADELRTVLDLEGFVAGAEWVDAHVQEIGDPYIYSKELVQLYTLRDSHTLYRDHGIRMNCVSPGEMETPMIDEFRAAMTDKIIDAVAAAGTLGRMATPEEVAPAVVFLASDLARYCSGTILNVDGGWTAVNLTDQVDYSVFS